MSNAKLLAEVVELKGMVATLTAFVQSMPSQSAHIDPTAKMKIIEACKVLGISRQTFDLRVDEWNATNTRKIKPHTGADKRATYYLKVDILALKGG